jgi:hypothetical protein
MPRLMSIQLRYDHVVVEVHDQVAIESSEI